VKVNSTEALLWWSKAAVKGQTEAQINMAKVMASKKKNEEQEELLRSIIEGIGATNETATWLHLAAEDGSLPAQVEYGRMLMRKGEPNLEEAAKWFQRAALYHSVDGMHELAKCYLEGTGVQQDANKAFKWFKAGAKQRHLACMFALSICYTKGEGVKQDDQKAWRWLQQAAEGGLAAAMFNAFIRLDDGRGVEPDQEQALQYLRKAAQADHPKAQYNLALRLKEGFHCQRDPRKAAELLSSAAQQGHSKAKEVLEEMVKGYTGRDSLGNAAEHPEAQLSP